MVVGEDTGVDPVSSQRSMKSIEQSKGHPEKRPVCEEIQRRMKMIQHKMSKITEKPKRKSNFFTATPQEDASPSAETGKLSINKSSRKPLLEKLLDPGDRLEQTVQVEGQWLRKLCIVRHGTEFCLLGADFFANENDPPTIGLVVKILWNTQVSLDGDGGFSVVQCGDHQKHFIFKPVSVQALWTVIQTLHMINERLTPKRNSLEVNENDWVNKYVKKINSNQSCINEWHQMADLLVKRPVSPDRLSLGSQESFEQIIRTKLREIMKSLDLDRMTSKAIRIRLETEMGKCLESFKSFIDKEILIILGQMDSASKIEDYLYLGSEWNASNLEELRQNGITHILNVTREIDNFFPGNFQYFNVRVYDEEATDLLKYFNSTYNFIKDAKISNGKVLVHCKMGISRSASVTISFLMKEKEWSLERSIGKVKKDRPIVKPNRSFICQLKVYEGILGAKRHRRFYQLYRSKSENCLSPREDDVDGSQRPSAGKKPRRRQTTLNLGNQSSSPISSPKRQVSDIWRPKSWSPNDETARLLLGDNSEDIDDQFEAEDGETEPVRCRHCEHFHQTCDILSSACRRESTPSDSMDTSIALKLSDISKATLPVNTEPCDCDQMEFELSVPTEPVSVARNCLDPATDVLVQSLSNIPLQMRTQLNTNVKLSDAYSSSSSVSSFSLSVPSTPIVVPKRQSLILTQDDENGVPNDSDDQKLEVLSVKTLANMFDFRTSTALPSAKGNISRLEDSKIYQRASQQCEDQENTD